VVVVFLLVFVRREECSWQINKKKRSKRKKGKKEKKGKRGGGF